MQLLFLLLLDASWDIELCESGTVFCLNRSPLRCRVEAGKGYFVEIAHGIERFGIFSPANAGV
jgi:hypothetical protein